MLTKVFKYKSWADSRTLEAISKLKQTKSTNSLNFALQQLNHMVIVEELFKNRLTAEPELHEQTNSKTVPNFEELSNRLNRSNKWYLNFIANLEEQKKTYPISFTFKDGNHGKFTVEEVLFHIINHGSYHRGNIAHALDLGGIPHPIDGYGAYIHEVEPERRVNPGMV